MMVEITPQLVLSGLQTAGLLIGILYYILDLQNQREDQKLANARQDLMLKAQEQAVETRQLQLFTHYLDRIWQSDIQEVFDIVNPHFDTVDEFFEKYDSDIKFQRVFFRWAYYWENVGTLLKLGYLPIEFIATSSSTTDAIFIAWERFRDVVYRFRETGHRSRRNFAMWEYLYDELVKYIEEHPETAA